MSHPSLRIALVGLGYWGRVLLRVFGVTPGVSVVAVCDSDAATLAAAAPDRPAVADVDSLLARSDIDAIVIATPPSTHYTLARRALAADKHCWVEKPLAMHAAEARALVALAAQHRRILFVDETFLYDPLVQRAKQWIDDGRLGRLFHLSFERLGMGRIRRDSGVWWNSAPHDLSILCHLVPAAAEQIRVESFSYLQPGIADMAVATLRLGGGVSAHVYVSWLSPLKAASIVAVGSRGMLQFEGRFGQRALRFFDYRVADPTTVTGNVIAVEHCSESEMIAGGREEPLALAAEAFVCSIRTGVPAASAGVYSQRVVELLEAADRHPIT